MSASPSIHYQDVDSSVLLPLVSWWSSLPSTSTNNSRRGFHGCGPATWNALLFSVRTDNRSSDASGRALKRHLYSICCRLLLLALQRLLMWRIINAMIIIIRHSLVRAKGEVFVLLYVFCSFFVNDFSTTRGLIHAKCCMWAYSGSGCVFSPFGG